METRNIQNDWVSSKIDFKCGLWHWKGVHSMKLSRYFSISYNFFRSMYCLLKTHIHKFYELFKVTWSTKTTRPGFCISGKDIMNIIFQNACQRPPKLWWCVSEVNICWCKAGRDLCCYVALLLESIRESRGDFWWNFLDVSCISLKIRS